MCGRYVASRGAEELVAAFGVDVDTTAGALRPTFNAAPTSRQPVVRHAGQRGGRGARGAGAADSSRGTDDSEDDGGRELALAAWGLVPFFAREPVASGRTINARVETVLDKPSYRRAVRTSRCLVPVDGWYEWRPGEVSGPRGGRGPKQPYLMSPPGGGGLALAGICETWRPKGSGGDGDEEGDGAEGGRGTLLSFSVLTRPAQAELGVVHERMPAVLGPDLHERWLDPDLRATDEVAHLLSLVRQHRTDVTAVPVGSAVGSVRSHGPELVVPTGPALVG